MTLWHVRGSWGVVLAAVLLASSASATERELDQDPPPSSTREIETPIQRVFPTWLELPSLFPGLGQQLQDLPPFLADTALLARYRTYYKRQDRTIDVLSEAWAMGGSLHYRSGWLADAFQLEAVGFTSQPIYAPDSRDTTLLLAPGQEGYSVLGIANARLRYEGIILTGYRQYLDLPYLNRQDNRMTPNTFESLTLAKPAGELRFSTGYTWKIKFRNSDEFQSMTKAIGLGVDRGLAHAGAVWDPNEDFHIGAIGSVVPDLFAGGYSELGFVHDLTDELEARLDTQFTFQADVGDDLLGDELHDTWNLGIRGSTSYEGAVFRLGLSLTGPNGAIVSPFGTNPTYVNLMQRTFNSADEKALLASASYDFSRLGVEGLSAIVNFVAAFDGKLRGVRRDAQELDVTFDYRIKHGFLKSFWLRVRGSGLSEEGRDRDGSDLRVILRYDLPII